MYAVLTALDLVLELPPGRSQSVQHVPACPCPEIRAARDPAVPVAPDPCHGRLDLVGVPVALVAEAFEAAHWSCRIEPARRVGLVADPAHAAAGTASTIPCSGISASPPMIRAMGQSVDPGPEDRN